MGKENYYDSDDEAIRDENKKIGNQLNVHLSTYGRGENIDVTAAININKVGFHVSNHESFSDLVIEENYLISL
jgi:hypothetical protein